MERPDCRGQEAPKLNNPKKAQAIKQRGEEPMRQALYRVSGVDLTGIDAIGVENVQLVVSEYGPDLSKFPSEHEFVSHATLAPHQPTSGGKPTKNKRKRGSASSRVAGGLRMAATSLRHSQTALGAYYRRAAARNGADVAVFATARKLATLIYRLLRWGKPFWRYTPPPETGGPDRSTVTKTTRQEADHKKGFGTGNCAQNRCFWRSSSLGTRLRYLRDGNQFLAHPNGLSNRHRVERYVSRLDCVHRQCLQWFQGYLGLYVLRRRSKFDRHRFLS
jgi:hypothetical protein